MTGVQTCALPIWWWFPRLPLSPQPVQPFTKVFELQLQFSFYFRRHSSRSKKVPEHVGIALLRSGNSPFGVVPVAHAVGRFDNCGEHKAEIQIRPDEVKECLAGFVPDSQAFVAEVAHIQILRRNHSSGGTSICGLCAIRSAGCRHTTGRKRRAL